MPGARLWPQRRDAQPTGGRWESHRCFTAGFVLPPSWIQVWDGFYMLGWCLSQFFVRVSWKAWKRNTKQFMFLWEITSKKIPLQVVGAKIARCMACFQSQMANRVEAFWDQFPHQLGYSFMTFYHKQRELVGDHKKPWLMISGWLYFNNQLICENILGWLCFCLVFDLSVGFYSKYCRCSTVASKRRWKPVAMTAVVWQRNWPNWTYMWSGFGFRR